MRRTPIPALLLGTLLAAPLCAQIPGGLRTAPRAQAPGNGTTVVVWPRHVQTLQARLDSFATALPAAERALWNDVLLRAAHAPTPATRSDIRVSPVLEIGPGGGCEVGPGGGCEVGPGGGCQPGPDDGPNRVAVILQGGRTAGAGGGIIAPGGGTRTGIAVQGTRPGVRPGDAPRPTPTGDGTLEIGPKQDDPGAPRPGRVGAVAIGPKQDDPAPPPQSLARRIAALAAGSPAEEQAALNWLLTRAASAPEGRPGTPGGLPPGTTVSLRQALGIEPLAIGPKQDDPRPPTPEQRWILRF
ncbi:MAG TPA: hypothetical protein VF006_25665 [Longimicrobium sp.]